jgi:hypothetical protein
MDGRRARIVLGVADDAGPDDIRRAFRARAQVTHPDHGGDTEHFTDLLAAVDALRPSSEPLPGTPLAFALPVAHPRVDVYDSPRRPAPARDFADVLRAAQARFS